MKINCIQNKEYIQIQLSKDVIYIKKKIIILFNNANEKKYKHNIYFIKCCTEADDIFNFSLWYESPKSKELITSSKSNTSFTFSDELCFGLFFIINENLAKVHWNQPDSFIFSSDFFKSKI